MKIDENNIRVGCLAGAPILYVSKKEEILPGVAGIYISHSSEEYEDIITNSDVVMLNYIGTGFYEKVMAHYLKIYGNGKGKLSGPGIITVLHEADSFSEYKAIFETIECLCFIENVATENIKLLSNQPVLVIITKKDNINYWLQLYKRNLVHGFIFSSEDFLKEFQLCYPHIFTIFEFNLFSWKYCEAYAISDSYIVHYNSNDSDNLLAEIQEKRIQKIVKLAKKPKSVAVRIGIVALQGAYHQERELIQNEAVVYDLETVFVRSKNDMIYLDGLVLHGGWHNVQYDLYSREDLGIFEGIQELIDKGVPILFSCAGAILARNPNKTSDGCFEKAANFMDYGVINNSINGTHYFESEIYEHKQNNRGLFIGAPKFVELGEKTIPIGKIENGDIIAVMEEKESGSRCIASVTHDSFTAMHFVCLAIVHFEKREYYMTTSEVVKKQRFQIAELQKKYNDLEKKLNKAMKTQADKT